MRFRFRGIIAKQYLAAALDYRTGQIHYVIGNRKDNALFRELLQALEKTCGPRIKRIFLVLDNYKIHKAEAVDRWLEQHPRFHIKWLPAYCPQANPIERAFVMSRTNARAIIRSSRCVGSFGMSNNILRRTAPGQIKSRILITNLKSRRS